QLKVIEEHNNKITFKLATNKSRRRLDSTELMGNISQYSGINTVKMTEC
ncbi:MgtC/SapB family protein, partial [Turicibacter sanguinis]|nr:MgtC/SapB family protein [Turicibacter sanguinis]